MAPRSFSTDGAQGAGGGNGASPGSGALGFGMALGASSAPPGSEAANFSPTAAQMGNGALNGFGGVWQGMGGTNAPPGSEAANFASSGKEMNYAGTLPGFDDGGSMPDGGASGNNDLIGLALATVDSALQYGRQKYGLGGDLHQSSNVEDRRNESGFGQSVTGPINNFAGNAYDIYNRATGYGINPDDANNPVGQAAGVNNVDDPRNKTLQGLGDDGTLDDTQGGQ